MEIVKKRAIEACKAILTFLPLGDLFIMSHALLTFSCRSFFESAAAVQRARVLLSSTQMIHTIVKRGLYHVKPAVVSVVWRERELLFRSD